MTKAREPRYVRRGEPLNHPLPATHRWLAKLPDEVQPLALIQQFPRIANVIARHWSDETDLQAYLESLLVDRRGGRRGFPPAVHNELLTLREFASGRYPAAGTIALDGDKAMRPPV